MTLKQQVTQDLERLAENDLQEVAEFVAFLHFRTRCRPQPIRDESRIAALYAECAEEDRALAEAGMAECAAGLAREGGYLGVVC